MEEVIQNILNKTDFAKKEKLRSLLKACLQVADDTDKSTYAIHESLLFKINIFFAGIAKILNSEKKDKSLTIGLGITELVLEELSFELDPEDVFVFFHLRNLGKFRLKESKLQDELKVLWQQNKAYQLEEQDFSRALKSLMRAGLIDYRRGNIWLKTGTTIRYRN